MLNELLEKLTEITSSATEALAAATTEADVENVKNKTIGRNGSLTALAPMMGKIAKEDKPVAGNAFNEAKTTIQNQLEEARERLADASGASAAPEKPSVFSANASALGSAFSAQPSVVSLSCVPV